MTFSNSCVIVVNNILREYIDDFPQYLSQSFEKLSEILPNIIPTIKNCNIDWNNQQNKIDFTDNETNTILHILIQPTYKDLKDTIKILTDSENIKERYIVYIGSHGAGYSSNWLLEDGIFSANSMFTTLSETSWIENNSMESSSINILTPGNSAHWNKILSTLKIKESKQDRVRVFSFSSEIKDGEESAFNKDIKEFCQALYKKYQPILLNDDIINSSQNFGTLQLMNKNGSFYVFDEGCGQSSLLALNGFNLLIDGGYKRAPEFWNFLQKLEKIDTYMMTSWNEINLFGMESLLDFKSKSAENSGDLSRPNLNYCVLPIGPNPHKEKEKLEIKSHLEINIEMESQRILHQIKSLEIPLLQMSRDAKSILSPHQLYFKLGQGCLDAFPLCPCSAETSGDSKRYVDEWQKESKLQTIYFDELVKDNASAFLLIWNGSKVTVESPTEEANMLTRILISSSCHESNLLKSLEEFSKINPICNSFSGKPTEKKTVEKKPISADTTKKSTVPAKEISKSMTDKANAAKKHVNSIDKNKEINKGDVQNKLAEKKLQPSADKSAKGKLIDKKDEKKDDKKDDIVTSKLSEEKIKHIDKKIPPSKASHALQPTKKINDKSVDVSDSKKPIKKSIPTDKVLETNEAKKPIKKPLSNDKTPEIDDNKKNVKKPLTTEKVTEAGDGKKPLKKAVVSDKRPENVDVKKSAKKTMVIDKSTDSAEVKKLTKKPLSNEKPIETQDTKKSKKPLLTDKGSEVDAKKSIKKTLPNEKSVEIVNGKKKLVKDEIVDQKKLPKRPTSEKLTEKPVVNKKSTTGKSEIETKKVKDSKSLPQHKIAKKADVKCPDSKKDDKNIIDVTVIKNDLESDLEKVEVLGQPSISLNTDDTLNNIDTSELLGKMEVIGPNSNHVEDEQLLITAERYDLQSTPLSDMITDSPEHPKTEEDVEALKTDALSIDQDLLINNEEFPEDDKVTVSVNDEFIEECEIKAQEEIDHPNISDEIPVVEDINDSDSKDLHQEFVLESQNLKDYGIYEDGDYDDEHKIESVEDIQATSENFEFVKEFEIEPHESKDAHQEPFEFENISENIEKNQLVKEAELILDLHIKDSEEEKETEKINAFNLQKLDHDIENSLIVGKVGDGLTNETENEMIIDAKEMSFTAKNDQNQNNHHIDEIENNELKSHLYEYKSVTENNYESEQEIQKEISFEKESQLDDILNKGGDRIDINVDENFGNNGIQEDKQISGFEEYDKKQNDIDDDLNIKNQNLLIDDNKCYGEENIINKFEKYEVEEKNEFEGSEVLPKFEEVLQETLIPDDKIEKLFDNLEYHKELDNPIKDFHVEGIVSDYSDKFDSESDFQTHNTENFENNYPEKQLQKYEHFSDQKIQDEKYDSEKESEIEIAKNVENKNSMHEEYIAHDNVKFNKSETHEDAENFSLKMDVDETYDSGNEHNIENEKDIENVQTNKEKFEIKSEINKEEIKTEILGEQSDLDEPEPQDGENVDDNYHEKELSDSMDIHGTSDFQEKPKYVSEEKNDFYVSEDIDDIYHEKDLIDEAYIIDHIKDYPDQKIEENQDFEEHDPQATENIEDAYQEKNIIDETHATEQIVDYPEKEIEENQDSEEHDPQVSVDIEDTYQENDVIDETHVPEQIVDYPEKEIEENQDFEEHDPQISENIEDAYQENDLIDETHVPEQIEDYLEKEIEENQDSEEHDSQVSEDIKDIYHERNVTDEIHIPELVDYPEKEIEKNQDSEDIEDTYQENDVIDEPHVPEQIVDYFEKEIEENQDSEEEYDPQVSVDIEDAYQEKEIIDETHVPEKIVDYPEKEIEENQDFEEHDPQISENIEDTYQENDVIDETHVPEQIEDYLEKEIEENQDSEEHDSQVSEDIKDIYHERNVIDEIHIPELVDYPEKEIEKNQDSEEEYDPQASEDIENTYQEKNVIDETRVPEHIIDYPEKEIEENQESEEDNDPQVTVDIEDVIEENSVSEHTPDYSEKEMEKAHDIDRHDESHEKIENYTEQDHDFENTLETPSIENIETKNTDVVNDETHINKENEEKENEYNMGNTKHEIPSIENMHHGENLYDEPLDHENINAGKESQDEIKFEHSQDISNDYDTELPEKEMVDSYPESTTEHKEVFEDISETNVKKEESENHPHQDEILQESLNMEEAYKSNIFEDNEENDDGEMIIHDVASIGEMDHINESDENEDISENQHQSDNTSEVENQDQEYSDELENENKYKHEKIDCKLDQSQQIEDDKILEHNLNEDVIEDKNNDPSNFENDFDVSKEHINLYNYNEEENTQEIDNNESNLPEKYQGDNEESNLLEEVNLFHNITERPDSLSMDNYPTNDDLIHAQGDSASSENHQETDRIMPDSESNDSDLSVDIVKDHTADSSKDSEQETYVTSMPALDDIIEDASPSSPLLHESSELEPNMYNVNEVDNSQSEHEMNMTNVNITPDILRGLKHLNLSEPTEIEVEQIVEDVEIINYQTSIHDSDQILKSDITDLKDLVEISDKESKELDESAHILSPMDNTDDDRINMSYKADHDNIIGSVNGNHHYENFLEPDSKPTTHWNEPLGLPMPTLLSSKSTTKPATEKMSSQSSAKLKSANATSVKLNGTSSNTVSAMTHKSTDSPKSASSPRNSIPPKPSAPKSAPVSKSPASKSAKKPEIVDLIKSPAFYMEIAYIPVDHDGNVNPIRVSEAFFTRVRARQYILPGLEHSSEVLDMILAARRKWSEEDSEIEVRLTPIKMTDTLKKWAGQHAQELSQLNIKIGAAVEHCSVNLGGDNNIPCIAHRIDF